MADCFHVTTAKAGPQAVTATVTGQQGQFLALDTLQPVDLSGCSNVVLSGAEYSGLMQVFNSLGNPAPFDIQQGSMVFAFALSTPIVFWMFGIVVSRIMRSAGIEL